MGGSELRTGTSRFLEQGAFVVYKLVMAAYFLFWAVYWPRVEGFREQAVHQLTFWTWDVCTGYFIVSTVAALLCWRAMKKQAGPVVTPSPPPAAPRQGKIVRPFLAGQSSRENPPVRAPSATTLSTPTVTCPEAAAETGTAGAGLLTPQKTSTDKSFVPWGWRWLQLPLWNIACIGSLIITLVWFTDDYVRQVQQGVKNFDIQAHGLIAFFMLVDQMLVADEFKLKHLVISQIYGVIYIVFSIFWFYMAPEEDKYLYENILDWEMNRVQASIWAGVGIGVVVPVAAFIHYAFHRLREAIHGRFQAKRAAMLKIQASSIVWRKGSFHC